MLFKSQVYTQASGSVGGLTYAHNKGGLYTRARAIPTDPQTSRQVAVRTWMQTCAQRFTSDLTQAQRTAWDVYAANVPVINRLGDQVFLTGQNHYVRSNVPRLQAGLAIIDDGPTAYTLPTLQNVGCAPTSAGQLGMSFSESDLWAFVTGGALIVYQSAAVSPATNFFKGPFQFAGVILGDTGTPPTSPTDVTSLHPLDVNQTLFIRVTSVTVNGRLSLAQIIRATVAT